MTKSRIYRWKELQLDEPDGIYYYYRDLRKEQHLRILRSMGNGDIMIWGGIGYRGKMEIKFITGKLNSEKYIEMIDE